MEHSSLLRLRDNAVRDSFYNKSAEAALAKEVAYTRVMQPSGQTDTNCADGVGVGTICDFQVGNWSTASTSPPDMSLTKIRYDIAIDGYPWG